MTWLTFEPDTLQIQLRSIST